MSTIAELSASSSTWRASPHTVRAWVRYGRLRPVRLCRRLLFHPAEVARFLAEAVPIQERTS
jgi:hypothetical protein